MRARFVRRQTSEAGFTLVELLVVMVIMGVVGTIVASGLVRGMRTSGDTQSRIYALTDLERGMQRVARELRVADPLCLAPGDEASHLGASVYRDGKRYQYDYYLDGAGTAQRLLHDVTVFDPPDAATGTTQASGVFIADVANDLLGAPLFRYFDQNNVETASYATAAQVRITLSKQVRNADPIFVQSTVEIRNTRYSGGGGTC